MTVLLCPGQGAQAVGMGKAWRDASPAAAKVFVEADAFLDGHPLFGAFFKTIGVSLSELCFAGPAETLNRTDISQPAIYVCSIACAAGLAECGVVPAGAFSDTAGLSLGEYTALHLAGAFSFLEGLELVATRGMLMQQAAVASQGGMLALVGADEAQALAVCDAALMEGHAGEVLVCANFNAPGQIVLSGSAAACDWANTVAGTMGLRATRLTVAGAFHSPLMQPAADRLAAALEGVEFRRPRCVVWSNVTAQPHPTAAWEQGDRELLRRRLVEQLVRPVRWAETCGTLTRPSGEHSSEGQSSGGLRGRGPFHELAPGTVLKGLMRRIDRSCEVINHDQPAALTPVVVQPEAKP